LEGDLKTARREKGTVGPKIFKKASPGREGVLKRKRGFDQHKGPDREGQEKVGFPEGFRNLGDRSLKKGVRTSCLRGPSGSLKTVIFKLDGSGLKKQPWNNKRRCPSVWQID